MTKNEGHAPDRSGKEPPAATASTVWYRVLDDASTLPDGRVVTVAAGTTDVCLVRYQGRLAAMSNRCPHQGGPLGEGSIEKGWLRCPWHGWEFHPCTGLGPGQHGDGVPLFPVEERDGAVYVGVEPEPEHEPTVSDVVVETLVRWGVDRIFGMVGHSNLGLADAMRRAEEAGKLRYFGIRHENAGAFAASAYGKLTGRPAACFAIAGPGSTNLFTGMWDAKVDRAPLIALTGQVANQVVGTGNFQEVDLVRAFTEVAAFNHRMQTDSKHGELTALAVKHALWQRDVAHLTFPDDVQTQPAALGTAVSPEGRVAASEIAPPEPAFEAALNALRKAERPVLVMGHGARFHTVPILELAERLGSPVLTTFKGKGLVHDRHPLACGVLGRSGTPVASYFMNEADLLLVFGASFSNHTGITPKIETIQVDFDPLALGKFHPVEHALWGEIGVTVRKMLDRLGEPSSLDRRAEIAERWGIWRREKRRRLGETDPAGRGAPEVFDALTRLAPDHAVFCVDVGNNAYSFGRYFEPGPGSSFLMSGYLGSIGFALPAALGAFAAVGGERPIIAVAGDGGFAQCMADWNTTVQYAMPIKMLVLDNAELGKISKEQRAGKFAVWKTRLSNPDFAAYARDCGSAAWRVDAGDDLDGAMAAWLAHEGPGLLAVTQATRLL